MNRSQGVVSSVSLMVVLISGCGVGTTAAPAPVSATGMSGRVFGGQNPINNSLITLWVAGNTGYSEAGTSLATTNTAEDGTFSFAGQTYSCNPDDQIYITATGGDPGTGVPNNAIELATGLGSCSSLPDKVVEINEVTTVVTAFALAQFSSGGIGGPSTDYFGGPAPPLQGPLQISNGSTIPMLINVADGTVNPNTPVITIDAAKIYTMANILAACVNSDPTSTTTCNDMFAYTFLPGEEEGPTDTLEAALFMAYAPYQNVHDLWKFQIPDAPFPGLKKEPNDWTIGVSYTSSAFGLGIAGTSTTGTSSNIDIDTSGKVWFPSNLPTATGVGYFDPSTNTFSTPLLTSFTPPEGPAVSLIDPQYLAIDEQGILWVTDLGSSALGALDTASPANAYIVPLSAEIGDGANLGPVGVDAGNNVFIATLGSGTNGYTLIEVVPNFATPENTTVSVLGPLVLSATGFVALNFAGDATADPPVPASSGGYMAGSYGGYPCVGFLQSNAGTPPSSGELLVVGQESTCTSGLSAASVDGFDYLFTATSANDVYSAFYAEFASGPFGASPLPLVVPLSAPEGIATDGYTEEWVANSSNGSVSTFGGVFEGGSPGDVYPETSDRAYLHDSSNGNTMTMPYGLAIDGSGNVWVSNASCVTVIDSDTPCTPTAFVLSELIGVAGPSITPLSNQMGGGLTGTEPGEGPVSAARGTPMRRAKVRPAFSRTPWLHSPRTPVAH